MTKRILLLTALLFPPHWPSNAAAAPLASRETEAEPRRYPPGRASMLKARLLDDPTAADASVWAADYVDLPELDRLEPMARAAERLWAARIGLAAKPPEAERRKLRALASSLEECPLDSLSLRRAATGLGKVGVIVPLSGRFERYGKTFSQGLRLALDEHNRVFGPAIGLILHDSEGDPLVGARKARWLLKDHGVSVIVGELFSANTAPLAAASQVVGAVLISPSATNERLATLGDAVFQLHIGDGTMAGGLARFLARESPRPSVAILADDAPDDAARALAVAAACRSAGLAVVGTERVGERTVDLTSPLAKLREKRAAALVLAVSPRLAGVIAAQLPTAWPGARVLGFDALEPEGLNAEARSALEGAVYFASDYALVGAPRDSFETAYARAYADTPTRMAIRGYLVGLAIARGVERGSLNASMLREALRSQLIDSDEGRALRALNPAVAAEPERWTIHNGKGVAARPAPVSP